MKKILKNHIGIYVTSYLIGALLFPNLIDLVYRFPWYSVHFFVSFLVTYTLLTLTPQSRLLKYYCFFPIFLLALFWIFILAFDFIKNDSGIKLNEIKSIASSLVPFVIGTLVIFTWDKLSIELEG